MFFTITSDEIQALYGLPHIQQVLYFRGIRPYMDRKTGVVGIKRRISYQSLREALYVEPIAGTQSIGTPSFDQVRRAVKQLVRKGLLEVQPARKQLVFKCVLALRDKSVQNKAATWPPEEAAMKSLEENPDLARGSNFSDTQATSSKTRQAATPHKDNNFLFFLREQFEAFWKSYPLRQGKQKAWEIFESLSPDEQLTQKILQALEIQVATVNEKKALGIWVPNWKNPANWLAQQCWEDEVIPATAKEKAHASDRKNHSEPVDIFWESCKSGATYNLEAESNVIEFSRYREGC